MVGLQKTLFDVVEWYRVNAPQHVESLRPSAGIASVSAAAEATGIPWHPSIVEWFATHDGQPLNSRGILPSHRLLPLREAIASRELYLTVKAQLKNEEDNPDVALYDPWDTEYDEDDDPQIIRYGSDEASDDEPIDAKKILEEGRRIKNEMGFGMTPREQLRIGRTESEVTRENAEGEGSRFADHYLPIAAWDDDVFIADLRTGHISEFEPVDGVSNYRKWPTVTDLLEHLLGSLRDGEPFETFGHATVIDGQVEWDFGED